MKRFLSLLTVFVLAFSLVVPASAVDVKKYRYGTVELTDIDTVWTDKGTRPLAVIVTVNDTVTLYTFKANPTIGNTEIAFTGGNTYYYDASNDIWTAGFQNAGGNIKLSSNFHWSNFDIVASNGNIIVKASEPVEVGTCDGSSCPATDVNIDGICDDCGMTLMSLSRTPVPPDVTGNNKNYVMFYSGTVYQYTAYTSDSSYTIRGEEYGARYRTYLEPSATATRFQSYDGINWEQTYNGTTANDYPGEIGWELISSTYDWYTEEGDRFFPVPLWEEVQTVTQGEMGTLTSETAGTMKTLVVCGVGLMACLMALSLFGKRWLLFLR